MPTGTPYDADATDEIKRKIISAFHEGHNITLTKACLIADVSRSVVYEWMDEDPEFKTSVNDARKISLNNGLDIAEMALMKKIYEEDRRAIFYFLDRKGGDRGYNPKIIADGTNFNMLGNSLMIQGVVAANQSIGSDADTDTE